ncbi:MAG: hypothetical protein ACREVA_00095 [Burkholderiales bacterium]
MTNITLLGRYRVSLRPAYLSLLEKTTDSVSIRGTPYERFTWRGVPGKYCDVIIARSIYEHRYEGESVLDISEQKPTALPEKWKECALELGRKAAKYDRIKRLRYAIRRWPKDRIRNLPRADLRICLNPPEETSVHGSITIIVRPESGPAHVDEFACLRSELEGSELARIPGWHWRKFFTHLTDQDGMREWCDGWGAVNAELSKDWTLSEANQQASRDLYRLSRQLGWRKMTVRERLAHGLTEDSPQWQRADEMAARAGYRSSSQGIDICDDPALVPSDMEILGWEIEDAYL